VSVTTDMDYPGASPPRPLLHPNSVHRTASASRTYGRCAVDPDGPILDPNASTRRAQIVAEEQKERRPRMTCRDAPALAPVRQNFPRTCHPMDTFDHL
jgi:hypothetical protein